LHLYFSTHSVHTEADEKYIQIAQKSLKEREKFQGLGADESGLRSLEVAFPPHDSSDAGSNPAEVVKFLRTEKFWEQVLREGL
jgi:hypothetical protein